MTRGEMLSRMSSEEFAHWMVLEQIEPFGERAEYIRAGNIAAATYNVHRGKRDPLTWQDIFPWFDKPPDPEPRVYTWQEIAAQFAALLEDDGQRKAVFNATEAN